MWILKALYHLKPYTELINAAPHPCKECIGREAVVWGTIVSRYNKALVVELSGSYLGVNSIEQILGNTMLLSNVKRFLLRSYRYIAWWHRSFVYRYALINAAGW
jgi:hypothetical protein